jgi:hypothetical protein
MLVTAVEFGLHSAAAVETARRGILLKEGRIPPSADEIAQDVEVGIAILANALARSEETLAGQSLSAVAWRIPVEGADALRRALRAQAASRAAGATP